MSIASAIGEISCLQNFYKGLNGECKLRSIDSTDTNLKAVTSTNFELLGAVINIFKDSTETGQLNKSFNSNIASKESSISTLQEKVVTSEKFKSKDIAETIYGTPAIQDVSTIGSGINGSTTLTNVLLSSNSSKICNEIIASSAPFDEKTGSPSNIDERKNNANVIEEKSRPVPVVSERSGTASVANQKSGTPGVGGGKSGIPCVGGGKSETSGVVGDKSDPPGVVGGKSDPPCVSGGKSETSGVGGGKSETQGIGGGKSEIPGVVGSGKSGTADVVGSGKSGTADVVGSRSGTVDVVGNRSGTTNLIMGKARYEMNEKLTNVRKTFNKNCPDTKSKHSSKLNPNRNFINKKNSQRSNELEFIEAINSANSDMVKKSRKLLLKQQLVSEILSYIQATQSVCRLLVPRNRSVDYISRNKTQNFDFNSNEDFHSAGECILEELQLYLNDLKSDYKDWEAKRLAILHISERIPSQFELCKSENLAQILMHNISTRICNILQDMNDITSKRENRNLEFTEIGESIDSYIRFSSSFLIDKYPSF